jgi:hypothetical protein
LAKATSGLEVTPDFLLFHEGNISEFDQRFIQRFSSISLKFVNVSQVFRIGPSHQWTGRSSFNLGYSLMCKFNYFDLWPFVADYEVVCRVDEDCMIRSLPSFQDVSLLSTGGISDETHGDTLRTLKGFLASKGMEDHFDQKFPYTNVYLTKVSFWLRPDVQDFLSSVASHPLALEMRWGDLPVLGVALKAFGFWEAELAVSKDIEYFHLSHRSKVANGKIQPMKMK